MLGTLGGTGKFPVKSPTPFTAVCVNYRVVTITTKEGQLS